MATTVSVITVNYSLFIPLILIYIFASLHSIASPPYSLYIAFVLVLS